MTKNDTSRKPTPKEIKSCPELYVLALNDTINVFSGKWKFAILSSITFGKQRYTDIQNNIPKITPRMLSKELKDLEMNGMITRIVHNTIPVIIEYKLTKSGESIKEVIEKMVDWGITHRKQFFENYDYSKIDYKHK
ncbi:helix-turn-helix transcriptional regulator [Flavobacterium sp. CYK-4]|uniref:winged helix-turn-helix transcriptional regulator n=1 Tax=Flavobacterium lotistagni TaxID=2709660 RepID=UPI001407592F|nr:helix-turn-helix domain-containing protein [Flavobacterium lotistagni]NHM07645.1 helix-turn-helix transcriptional regulator [Flavobacterium lotistagni]